MVVLLRPGVFVEGDHGGLCLVPGSSTWALAPDTPPRPAATGAGRSGALQVPQVVRLLIGQNVWGMLVLPNLSLTEVSLFTFTLADGRLL